MSKDGKELSATDRLRLIQTLNALPSTQFDELVFALRPPSGNIPGASAPQGNRSSALLEWVESPIGSRLSELEQILESIISARSNPMQSPEEQPQHIQALQDIIQILRENQAPKYDLRGATFSGGFAENVYGDQVGSQQTTSET